MKHIARHENQVRREFDHLVDHARERSGDVGLALVTSGGRLALELPESEMQVGEMDEAHSSKLRVAAALREVAPHNPQNPSPHRAESIPTTPQNP